MAKPEIIVNAGTAGAMTSVSASSAWTATLDSVDGVRQVAWSVISTDETTTAESYTLVQSGSVGQNVASTSQGQGTAILLKAIVNAGVNAATGQADPTNTSATVKIVVPLSDGGIVGCAGEEYESDATFGATGIINSGIRKAAALSPSGVAVKIVRAATAAALPANTRTSNVLTANVDGAIGTVGGVAVTDGDYILVQNEGGGASHVNNGAFVLADGDGSNPWTLTRATYFDDSAELIAMTTFRIQEGTYAGKERYLVTSGATINVTALEFGSYAYAPVDPAYLMVGASGDLANERDISAIGTTLDFASTTTIPLQASRTDGATAALVDVETVSALSSGTAAAGFGPAIKFLGEISGGGAENYGRVGFAATDLTGGSEDTKAVIQARTAGAALATVFEASGTSAKLPGIATGASGLVAIAADGTLSRTASAGGASTSAKYVTDAAATVNANDVPLQAMTGTLEFLSTARPVGFAHETAAAGTTEIARHRRTITAAAAGLTGTGGYDSWWIPDGAGTEVEAFRLNARWNQVVGPYAEVALSLNSNGSLTERIVFGPSGAITTPGIITGASFIGVSLDTSGAATLTLGGTNATALTVSRTGIVTTVAGGLTVNGSATTDVIRAQKAGIGSTETVALWIENLTNSGTQQSPQAVWSAFNGGTQVNLGLQWEPQSTTRGKWVFYTGTGTTAPSGSGLTYWDSQDNNFGEGWISNGFYSGTTIYGGSGFRFMHSSNLGGMTLSSTTLVIKSYSANGIVLSIYSDSGSTLTSNVISTNGSGQGYARFIRAAPTSASNAVTFNLATSQNIEHALTENTTVSFSGAAAGMSGVLVFTNDGTGRTVTMPANGTGIEYDAAILALTVTGIVDATANTRTVLAYYVMSAVANRIYVYARSTSTIP